MEQNNDKGSDMVQADDLKITSDTNQNDAF